MEVKYIYPIGQQDFKTLRKDGALYVDKTSYIEKLVRSRSKYYFLARPRRFGKSLFLSSLRYFFEGERDLFKDLYIDSTAWNWEKYPVLYLDLNTDRYAEQGILDSVLDNHFRKWEKMYDVDVKDTEYSQRFKTIIENAHEKTGKQVVILVDEYDKPLVGNLTKKDNFIHYQSKLASLYSNFKSSAEHIRLVFMTGVSRFSKLSVFSDLNNISDISFSKDFADVCGITQRELLDNFQYGIELIAEKYSLSYDAAVKRLKENYDGYCFAPEGSDMYNPWALLNAMRESRIGAYWNATGNATLVADALRDADIDIEQTLNAEWDLDELAGLDLLNADPTSILYQAGYLTIASYDNDSNMVKLKVPNEEVRKGLFRNLLNAYLKPQKGTVKSIMDGIRNGIESGNPEMLMKNLDAYFAGIPYDLKVENENNFQNIFYVLLSLLDADVKAEMHTSNGRVDLLIETLRYIYVIELKYDSTPEQALRQIDEKGYVRQFATDSRHSFKIGVNFSSESRRIEDWRIK